MLLSKWWFFVLAKSEFFGKTMRIMTDHKLIHIDDYKKYVEMIIKNMLIHTLLSASGKKPAHCSPCMSHM